jgi:uncharacterized membrane protein
MGKNPKIKVPAGKLEILFNVLSVLLILGMIYYAFIMYQQLPEQIPTHFNSHGEPDDWGSKASIFMFPVIAIFIFVPMYFLSRVPHVFNYLVTITEENAPRIYPISRLMMATFNFSMVSLFAFLEWETVQAIDGNMVTGPWFVIIVIFYPLILLGFFAVWMWKKA